MTNGRTDGRKGRSGGKKEKQDDEWKDGRMEGGSKEIDEKKEGRTEVKEGRTK